MELAKLLGIDEFKASDGWLAGFKKRHSIGLRRIQGEAAAVDVSFLNEWRRGPLNELLACFSPADTYNADETGLFWRAMPEKTLAFSGEQCSGGKKSKERITVLCAASMSGEKLPLLVIGKAAKPRCFKNTRIPLEYASNSKAWMTGGP